MNSSSLVPVLVYNDLISSHLTHFLMLKYRLIFLQTIAGTALNVKKQIPINVIRSVWAVTSTTHQDLVLLVKILITMENAYLNAPAQCKYFFQINSFIKKFVCYQ